MRAKLARMGVVTTTVGDVRLTRIGYADVPVEPEVVRLTEQQVTDVPWAAPLWADAGRVRVGAAAWVIESGTARIVVDPAQAADAILRSGDDAAVHQEAFAAVLAAAGYPRDSFTHVVATHLDGIGMIAWREADGSWAPFFGDAPILFSAHELAALDDGSYATDGNDALAQLRDAGAVHAWTGTRFDVTDGVVLEHTGAHSPGHAIVRVTSNADHAVMLGHLAVSPLHLVTGECVGLHNDPRAAQGVLTSLRDEGSLLIGPLWPEPGAGRWRGEGFVALAA